jgi:hypothetical protein
MERGIGSTDPAKTAGEVVIVDSITGLPAGGDSNSATCSITAVGDEITSTQLLAANTSRKAVRVVNDSTAILYVACTEAASATNYTARLNQYDAVTIDGFTGAIYGLWASDAGGNARISEFS